MGLETEQEKAKARKLMCGDKDSSLSEEKNLNQPSPQVMQQQSLSTPHRQTSAQQVSEKGPPWKTQPPAITSTPLP